MHTQSEIKRRLSNCLSEVLAKTQLKCGLFRAWIYPSAADPPASFTAWLMAIHIFPMSTRRARVCACDRPGTRKTSAKCTEGNANARAGREASPQGATPKLHISVHGVSGGRRARPRWTWTLQRSTANHQAARWPKQNNEHRAWKPPQNGRKVRPSCACRRCATTWHVVQFACQGTPQLGRKPRRTVSKRIGLLKYERPERHNRNSPARKTRLLLANNRP